MRKMKSWGEMLQVFISFKLVEACGIAHDNGSKISVDSDYLRMWMIERDYVKRSIPETGDITET